MLLRRIVIPVLSLLVIAMYWPSHVQAQSKPSAAEKPAVTQAAARSEIHSAARVSAELVEGRLNPATSKPGDGVVVRLQEDFKVENQVLLKKGTLITGIVRSAKRAEARAKSSGPSIGQPAAAQSAIQSMVQVDWRAPVVSGAASRSLNLALETVAYTNPLYAHQSQTGQEDSVASRPSRSERPIGGAALLGGSLASGVVGVATNFGGKVTGSAASQTSAGMAGGPSGQAALPASLQTASALQSDFGVSGPTLFTVGHGQAISGAGTSSSIDLYSHMSNDSILTSSNKDFEIASGAQMGFMVNSKR
jgi:hypothetical protein